jgi:hypothetical protein
MLCLGGLAPYSVLCVLIDTDVGESDRPNFYSQNNWSFANHRATAGGMVQANRLSSQIS